MSNEEYPTQPPIRGEGGAVLLIIHCSLFINYIAPFIRLISG